MIAARLPDPTAAVSLSMRSGPVYRPIGDTCAARLFDLERRARASRLLGGPALPYDASCWDVTDMLPRRIGPAQWQGRQRLWFSEKPGHHNAKPMQQVVIGLAKAYVRLSSEGLGPSALRARLYAVRYLGDALAEVGARGVEDCTLATFDRALAIATSTVGEGATMHVAVHLEDLAHYMGACRLTRVPVGVWRHTATLGSPPDGTDGSEFHARAAAVLPTEGFLIACAEAFQIAVDPRDVIVTSVLALLGCAGGGARIGEVLRVREDFRTPKGMILPGSKGAAEHERGVLASMAELADAAVAQLSQATAEARAIKRAYDDDPTRLFLPPHWAHLRGKPLLTMAEAAAILGLKPGCRFHDYVRRNGLDLASDPGEDRAAGHRLSFAVVEAHILSRLNKHMRLAGGNGYHPLLLVRWGQFKRQTGSPCMFEVFGYQRLLMSIRPSQGKTSMFSRLELDPDGTVSGTTKSIRHLLNTLAHLAGLSDEDIAEISGRVGTGHNRHYDHTTPEGQLDDLDDFARHRERKRRKEIDNGK